LGETWTVLRILQWTAGHFAQKGIEGGRLDAELLLGDTLGLDRVGLYMNFDRPLTPEELGRFRQQVQRRAGREPLAYIQGETEFWSLPLRVGPDVLIPRPETEILVEEALKRATPSSIVLDVGTGSGAIAVALSHELPGASVTGFDISPGALQVAAENARRNGVQGRLKWIAGDLARLPAGPYDLVVSNPPYIPKGEMAGLMPEVGGFEPHLALCGGADGLDCYRHLARQAPGCLRSGGWLLLEVGAGQDNAVRDLLDRAGLTETFCRADYAGIGRVVGGRLSDQDI